MKWTGSRSSKRYVLHPDFVELPNGDIRKIGFLQLVKLYGLQVEECINWDKENVKDLEGKKHLYPRNDGNYKLEEK